MSGMSADENNGQAGARVETVETVDAFIKWVEKLTGSLFLYRGLAVTAWMVESSAYRQIKESKGKIFPKDPKEHITKLLAETRLRGFRMHEGRDLPDLELLARLQHFGAATCLIDFTQNPLVALWFACSEQADQAGKVVAMDTMDTGTDATDSEQGEKSQPRKRVLTVTPEQIGDDIKEFLDGERLWKWEPTPREDRVIAQQSTFVFGKQEIEGDYYEEVRIPASKKRGILRVLSQKFGITKKSLFGDFAGFALANAYNKSGDAYSADEYYALAEAAYQNGNEDEDHQKAIQYCDKAIAKDRQHVEAHHLRGQCNYNLKKWQDSADDFSRAIESDSTHTKSFMERGKIHALHLQEPEKAVDDYTAVIDFLSNSEYMISRWDLMSAYENRGGLHAEMGEHEKAVADFTSAIENSPKWRFSENTYRGRAESHRALGNERAARVDEEEAERVRQRRYRRFTRNDDRRDRRRPRDE